MSAEEIWEALESHANCRRDRPLRPRATASNGEINLLKKSLLDFLEEIDGDVMVAEVREALEDYRHDWR
ncbi:hypothetical protein [Methylopila sp. M107]|uniref:hypothetical protein n=1 Tax=Methylopila sp. M107 TaxID=1101190 RepID=UPI00036FD378|nr:hypothetical protein [Methylopila sp. M107]